ncbi:MAG: DUF1697 domain-containing protein [Thermoplasmata archaeon]
MIRYVAFLRGINVGDRIVRMEDLRHRFETLGFDRVSTYRASGNVVIDGAPGDAGDLHQRAERGLRSLVKGEVEVCLRSAADLEEIARLDPFRAPPDPRAIPYVAFLREPLRVDLRLPIRSPKSDVEVFRVERREVFSWGLTVGDHFGFPNRFVEDLSKKPATTRNWSTVTAVASLSASSAPARAPSRSRSTRRPAPRSRSSK